MPLPTVTFRSRAWPLRTTRACPRFVAGLAVTISKNAHGDRRTEDGGKVTLEIQSQSGSFGLWRFDYHVPAVADSPAGEF